MYNLTDIKAIKNLCSRYGFTFSKSLGQNFLTDENVLAQIAASAAEVSDCALEIGPGFGSLTCALGQRMESVVSLEVDTTLKDVLAETLAGFDNIKIVWKDVMKTSVRDIVSENFGDKKIAVAANLPYYITTPILINLLENCDLFSRIIIMVQKEVAQRLCAKPGTKDYGAITLFTSYRAQCTISQIVPAAKFFPAPKVDSAVVVIDIAPSPRVETKNEEFLFKLIRASFAQRRKTLQNALSNANIAPKEAISAAIASIDAAADIRGERLSLEEFAQLADYLACNI